MSIGAKPSLIGLNGAVDMQADRGALAIIELGKRFGFASRDRRAAIITEVALIRFFAISCRIASLTPGAMP